MSSGTQPIADLTTETKPTTGDIPPPLVGASTIVAGNLLFVFGGRLVSSRQMTNHLYILNLDTYAWTRHIPPPDTPAPPRPRYFHSCSLFNKRYLIIFGGMSHSSRRSSQGLCALDDVCLFDLESMCWAYPDVQPSIYAPQARYAHLAVISNNKLIVMGGQDMSNQYIDELNVFCLTEMAWIHGCSLARQYGAYRAVAFCPNSIDTSIMANPPFWESEDKLSPSLCVYSNYNFTDVTRDLQSFSPMQSTVEFRDHSKQMSGSHLPPGLRFPSGDIMGHHLILTGTYLTPTHQSFHIWALNLTNLVWVRIDTGSLLTQGSWNRGVLFEDKQQFIVFGDKRRDLLEDYNHRQVNFAHVAIVELEAFGIYTYPKETCTPVAQELGLSMLSEPGMADIEIMTDDGRSIPANSNVIALRWPYFANLLSEKSNKPGFKRLSFPESYSVTLAFLQYIYTDHLMTAQQHHPQILSRLLLLADVYHLPRLSKLATHALHQILTISTASLVYETSALTGKTSLQVRALRVMLNAKKMMIQQQQQQQQQQSPQSPQTPYTPQTPLPQQHPMSQTGNEFNIVLDSPMTNLSNHSIASSHSKSTHEEEEVVHKTMSAFRRLTASRSSSAASSEPSFAHPPAPSPKLSKSSTLTYQKPALIPERQRKGSLVPLPSSLNPSQQSQRKGSTPNPFGSMGLRF
ncbi:hypothetical protein EDC96DRAFT_508153 [Choanephora cucurbitarum]|nr:hypothetical protein EDC96DRAFT_508153 [Choanephora cucurbitarum]